jgi:hypothetical protein
MKVPSCAERELPYPKTTLGRWFNLPRQSTILLSANQLQTFVRPVRLRNGSRTRRAAWPKKAPTTASSCTTSADSAISCANARAVMLLPHPGGPWSRILLRRRNPCFLQRGAPTPFLDELVQLGSVRRSKGHRIESIARRRLRRDPERRRLGACPAVVGRCPSMTVGLERPSEARRRSEMVASGCLVVGHPQRELLRCRPVLGGNRVEELGYGRDFGQAADRRVTKHSSSGPGWSDILPRR